MGKKYEGNRNQDIDLEDTREFTPEEIAELRLITDNSFQPHGEEQPSGDDSFKPTVELSMPGPTGDKMELWSVAGGAAAGEVIERDANGEPTIWRSFGGSIFGTDSQGRPYKIRDKWG